MRFLKIITLLPLLLLQNCDFGCVSAEEFGVITLKNIELYADPFEDYGLRTGIVSACKPGCEDSGDDGECGTYNYWTPINEKYSKDYEYQLKVMNQVSFCSITDDTSIGNTSLAFELSSKIKKYIEPEFQFYDDDQYLSTWYDLTDHNIDAKQTNTLPIVNCAEKTVNLFGKRVILTTEQDIEQDLSLGNYSTLDMTSIPISWVERAVVPRGCKLELYEETNYNGFKLIIPEGDHTLTDKSYIDGGCADNSTIWVGPLAYEIEASGDTSIDPCLSAFDYVGGSGDININDMMSEVEIAHGCKIDLYTHCDYDTYNSTIHGGEGKKAVNWGISSYKILEEDSYFDWQQFVHSAKVVNDTDAVSPFTNTSSMKPQIKANIFDTLQGLKFDGENDFLSFDDAKSSLKNNYMLFFIVKHFNSGTLFSSSRDDLTLNERIYIDGSGIFSYQKDDTIYELSTAALPETSLITIIRSGSDLKVRVNGSKLFDEDIGDIDTNIHNVAIGQYWGEYYTPQDFMDGYLGTIRGYTDIFDDEKLNNIEKELMIRWDILKCGYGKHLDKVRLRVGEYETDQELFDQFGNFIIPDSYHNEEGYMMLRLEDPQMAGGGCTAVDDNKILLNDNVGMLELNFKITKDSSFVGNLYEYFIVPIEQYIVGSGSDDPGIEEVFFKNVVGKDSLIQRLIVIALVFFVMFTAISYLMGLANYSNWDLVSRIIKIGIILTLISDTSWEYFSGYVIEFFRGGALDLVGNISLLVNSETGVISGSSGSSVENLFTNLDGIFAMFISPQVNAKIWGLLFSTGLGFLMVIMFYYAFYIYIHIIAKVLILYVAIFIMLTFSFIIAPIFIIFVLFQKTKEYFTKWLDLVIGYSVQFIFLAMVVGIFSWIIMAFFIDLLNYTVCWKPVLYCCGQDSPVHFTLLEFFRPASFDYRRFNISIKQYYAPGFWDVALFLFIVYLFKEFLNFAMDLATRIAGGISTGSLADSIGKTMGTDNLGKTASGIATKGTKYGMRAAGAASVAVGSGLAATAGVVAGGSALVAKATGSTRAQNFANSAAKFAQNRINQSFSVGTKLMNDTYYKQAKGAVYNNTVGALNRAVGIRGPEEQQLINDIKDKINQGHINAATNGTSKKAEIEKSVRNMLEKKGMSESKINKILNSKQLQKDIKYSKLQTDDVQKVLSEKYVESYRKAINDTKKNPALLKGGTAHEYAKMQAKNTLKQIKKNVGNTLREEHAVQEGAQSYAGKFANYVMRESVETRLGNMARMSSRLEKDLESFGEEKGLADSAKESLFSTGRDFSRKLEAMSFSDSEDTKKEKEEYGLYDDQRKSDVVDKENNENSKIPDVDVTSKDKDEKTETSVTNEEKVKRTDEKIKNDD